MAATVSEKVHFPGLNGLRFFAAAFVIFQHVEQQKSFAKLPNLFSHPAVSAVGGLAVTLFFVLSGFLITYLLLVERERLGTVYVTDFYMRRILRIWPLYFLIACLGLFVFAPFLNQPEALHHFSHAPLEVVFYLAIMPNVASILFGPHGTLNNLWSVGVEEQFYLIWPVLMKYCKKGKLIALFAIVAGMWFLRKFLFIAGDPHNRFGLDGRAELVVQYCVNFFYHFRIDCMAIGGIGAFALHKKFRVLRLVFHRATQVVTYSALSVLLLTGRVLPLGNDPFYAAFFIVLILNVAANPDTLLVLDNPVLNYLGKISYGIYMYHLMTIMVLMKVLLWVIPGEGVRFNLLMYGCAYAATITIASLSYRFLEAPFLSFKRKFTHILSDGKVLGKPA